MTKITFPGGVYPAHRKQLTEDKPIVPAVSPKQAIIPLVQGIGRPAKCAVKAGDIVSKGQIIGEEDGFISHRIHSSVSGKVTAVKKLPNPSYGSTECVIIENDNTDNASYDMRAQKDISNITRDEIIEHIKAAGIVGLGGAAFPTHVKVISTEKHKVDALIINAVECEPYLTCDNRMMLEKPKEILKGIGLLDKAVTPDKIYIAIEDNKPEAITVMKNAVKEIEDSTLREKITVSVLRSKYPQGGEKQIVKAILNREVPPGKLPLEVGCIIQNVGTVFAIYEAVYYSKPLIERVVTITGSCIKTPGNYLVTIGTSLKDIVEQSCGGFVKEPSKVIFGGPMMGIAQFTLDLPIIKGVSGVLFLTEEEVDTQEETDCIKCAKCVDACPVNLMPTLIARNMKKNNAENLKELNVSDCMECGSCSFVCPARIPLVQYLKLAKEVVRNICN